MKVYLFSVGEATTKLTVWSYERLGLKVVLLEDPNTSFYQKYCQFVEMALADSEPWVLRADADVIVNKRVLDFINNILTDKYNLNWWCTAKAFCFLRMDIIDSCPNLINRQALEVCKKRLPFAKHELRVETALTRMPEFLIPRRFKATDYFIGLHGYKQHDVDVARVINTKAQRGQLGVWDMELITKINEWPAGQKN